MVIPSHAPMVSPGDVESGMRTGVVGMRSGPVFARPGSFFFFYRVTYAGTSPSDVAALTVASELAPGPEVVRPEDGMAVFRK